MNGETPFHVFINIRMGSGGLLYIYNLLVLDEPWKLQASEDPSAPPKPAKQLSKHSIRAPVFASSPAST